MACSESIFDVVGIGVGPFNLGLAALIEPIGSLKTVFFDQQSEFNWHPGMMIEGSHLQTPFMSDLVTMADPTSPYSFLNYLKIHQRLYLFYIRENFFILRKEYNQYCQWVSSQLSNLQFSSEVMSVDYLQEKKLYQLNIKNKKNNEITRQYARKLVIGTGSKIHLPNCCTKKWRQHHSANYLFNKEALQKQSSITIVGSGQSAAEIFYDLLMDIDRYHYELSWITRSPRFFPLEYSKLTLEMTSPDYIDYFYHLPKETRNYLINQQKPLYKGINSELINDIYDLLYTKSLSNVLKVNLYTHSSMKKLIELPNNQGLLLQFSHEESKKNYKHQTQGLVFATGYQSKPAQCLDSLSDRIRWDTNEQFDANRNYTIDKEGVDIFVQNAEINTHGFVTPDLGMACYRNASIIKELVGHEVYPIEQKIAFQNFEPAKETNDVFWDKSAWYAN